LVSPFVSSRCFGREGGERGWLFGYFPKKSIIKKAVAPSGLFLWQMCCNYKIDDGFTTLISYREAITAICLF
jgi:uncharacterized membrane protein